ncbi:hypothetical protein [Mycolicibacterium bacteremicum]|uniref:Uncharacterized protein n=1 Tax=Mycolicibacterium bacteremicum TaxID=564198 RepID=A0A1W9Z4J5_MYCBA|nr:hypothetical protein [Mycolicibacterium bacteremicum]MCV7433709.1 hypothetical protein [Mycolicibacterium bacteremicum]ORA07251.1 hypothetical protein BST17_01955 [Mycolicibacterium bacteremicum]
MTVLKPGALGPPTDPTTPAEFAASMAAAIEDAYWNSLAADGKRLFDRTTNTESDRDRRRIFVAIAQGVTGHLRVNAAALRVTADVPLPPNTHIEIDVTP